MQDISEKNHEKKIDTEKLLIKHGEELLTVDVCHIIFCRYVIREYVCIKHHVLDNVLFIGEKRKFYPE